MGKRRKQSNGTIPRQVRMPVVLDDWLAKKAAEASTEVRQVTVAEKIREIVAAAREAEKAA
jgi:flavin-dependent dehydrogenase